MAAIRRATFMALNASPPTPECPRFEGLILIDKPLRRTSMDVCASIRSRFRRAGAPKRLKVGHAGTLDPLATGLLVVMVGKATRLCERFMAERKIYETQIDLSQNSTTDDAEGERTRVEPGVIPTGEQVAAVVGRFVGVIQQRPPAYSAMKVGGRRAYELARAGEIVELAVRPVHVYGLEVLRYEWPCLSLRIECGKGTYVRSLARDLGASLGAGGMLTQLRRTASGGFRVADARTLDSLPVVMSQGDLLPLAEVNGATDATDANDANDANDATEASAEGGT